MATILEEKKTRGRTHTVVMENRQKITITGVEDVDSFNESEILLLTDAGEMTVFGQELHISKLNLDEGQLVVEGYILGMDYQEQKMVKSGGGLFSRIFK